MTRIKRNSRSGASDPETPIRAGEGRLIGAPVQVARAETGFRSPRETDMGTPFCASQRMPSVAAERPVAYDRFLVTTVALFVLAAAVLIALVTAPFQIGSGRRGRITGRQSGA